MCDLVPARVWRPRWLGGCVFCGASTAPFCAVGQVGPRGGLGLCLPAWRVVGGRQAGALSLPSLRAWPGCASYAGRPLAGAADMCRCI